MKVLVISLARSSDRRPEIKRQLEAAGLDFEIVEAIEGSALSPEEMEAACDMEAIRARPHHLSPGAIGCALSHRKAYLAVLDQNLSHALIVEDDVVIPRELPAILDGIARQIADDEITLLHFCGFHPVTFSQSADRPLTGEYRMLFPLDDQNIPISGVGYVVPRAVCRTLLPIVTPIRLAADQWYDFMALGGFKKLSVVYPRPLGHGDFKSSIDYVEAYGSKLHALASKVINGLKIPILQSILRARRQRLKASMSDFRLSDQPSSYASPTSPTASPTSPTSSQPQTAVD